MGTGGKKMEDPHALKSNEMAQCTFQPQQPLVCDTFKNCEGLSRVAFMDGNGGVMLGKVISCEKKDEAAAGGKKSDRTEPFDALCMSKHSNGMNYYMFRCWICTQWQVLLYSFLTPFHFKPTRCWPL